MGTDKPTTFWVSRDAGTRFIELHQDQPFWANGDWQSDSSSQSLEPYFHQALGLPSEPEPGRCHRVDWVKSFCRVSDEVGMTERWIPTVRDVTDELKESSK